MVKLDTAKLKIRRFTALDQVRGLAVLMMICAHFGPGLYERAGLQGVVLDFLNFLGRIATPAFVLIFGITIAIIYVRKAQTDTAKARRTLLKRSGLVFFCSLAVALPETLDFILHPAEEDVGGWTYGILLRQYSVLSFYAVAIFITAFCIGHIARDPVRRGLVYGAALVFIGTYLGYDAWPEEAGTLIEIVRLLVVSGKYAVFVLLGCSWMMIAVGVFVVRKMAANEDYRQDLTVAAIVLTLLGLAAGRIVGWRSLYDLQNDYGAPPQIWYLLMIAGLMIASLVALDRFQIPFFSTLLELVGRSPLSFYIAHAFVLPSIDVMRIILPFLPDLVIIGTCMSLFMLYGAALLWRNYKLSGRSGFANPAPRLRAS